MEREREKEGGREREPSICCSIPLCIPWLIFECALTRGSNLQSWSIRMTVQPTELPGQGLRSFLSHWISLQRCSRPHFRKPRHDPLDNLRQIPLSTVPTSCFSFSCCHSWISFCICGCSYVLAFKIAGLHYTKGHILLFLCHRVPRFFCCISMSFVTCIVSHEQKRNK